METRANYLVNVMLTQSSAKMKIINCDVTFHEQNTYPAATSSGIYYLNIEIS